MSKELAVVGKGSYAITTYSEEQLREVVSVNLGGNPEEKIREFDLTRVKVPSGGGTNFTVLQGDQDSAAKEIVGVVVAMQARRMYWTKGIGEGGGNTPPDCWSPDAINGIGVGASLAGVNGKCANCPYSKFGSGMKDGRPTKGQACSEKRALFILEKDSILPTFLLLPPTSLAGWKKYLIGLIGKRVPVTGVVTKITLAEKKNAGGTKYAECRFTCEGKLDEAEAATMSKFSAMFSTMFKPERPDSDEHVEVTVGGEKTEPETD